MILMKILHTPWLAITHDLLTDRQMPLTTSIIAWYE